MDIITIIDVIDMIIIIITAIDMQIIAMVHEAADLRITTVVVGIPTTVHHLRMVVGVQTLL